jgi:ketosteroid isomerase-like protein
MEPSSFKTAGSASDLTNPASRLPDWDIVGRGPSRSDVGIDCPVQLAYPRMSAHSLPIRSQEGDKIMLEPKSADVIRITALLENWANAVRRHDVSSILAFHEPDIVMFDLPPPIQCKGIQAYEQTWDLFFRYHKPGAAFDFEELSVTAGPDVGFAVAIMRCGPDSSKNPADKDGFLFRLTVGLCKVDGDWRITHEHHSVPATD